MADGANRPLIVKRRKVVAGGGHHGGAWKVAYADFVTAMMAFFMLMWLLNATTESQRKGLADYFAPEIPLSRVSGGGAGAFGGDSPVAGDVLPENGGGIPGGTAPLRAPEAADALEEELSALLGAGGEQAEADPILRHVSLRRTDEGLSIELRDAPGRPLFAEGAPTPDLLRLTATIGEMLGLVRNAVAVDVIGTERWQDGAARAARVRAGLEAGGLDPARTVRLAARRGREALVAVVVLVPEGRR
ncbi:chemotaxis protein MotB [Hasllibacter halocynthiae]|uniref:Chemotaxis protein MotB n=1 Tax=Hasllibacter halocynthiae TaxID=595589 RepID=A0A2T0X2M4_9RHOB|nr:flagellar motor protein MotB [Hasllibacter halocynthiae]PRY93190.1 chemotaxis protein MotB [Hasllibacter halocynthiae]